jgi:hypothetical protein
METTQTTMQLAMAAMSETSLFTRRTDARNRRAETTRKVTKRDVWPRRKNNANALINVRVRMNLFMSGKVGGPDPHLGENVPVEIFGKRVSR